MRGGGKASERGSLASEEVLHIRNAPQSQLRSQQVHCLAPHRTTSSSPPHQHDSSSLVCHRCCRQHGQDRTLDGTHPEAAEAPGTEDGLEAGTKGGNCGGINRRRQEAEAKAGIRGEWDKGAWQVL